jgi:hypothetical protein
MMLQPHSEERVICGCCGCLYEPHEIAYTMPPVDSDTPECPVCVDCALDSLDDEALEQ